MWKALFEEGELPFFMIVTEKITISQKQIIDNIRKKYNHDSESHSFNSLYLWQKDMGLTIAIKDDAFIVNCKSRPNSWYFPCGNEDVCKAWIDELIESNEQLKFIYVRKEDVEFIKRNFNGVFDIENATGDSEYLYDKSAYLSLEGDGYRRIRRELKKLKSNYEVFTKIWDDENQNDMINVLKLWHYKFPGEDGLKDFGTSQLLLNHKDTLEITGVITYVNGSPFAMAAGFPLSENSFDIAFSKSVNKIPGLQDYTRQALARIIPDNFTILNGEDDLGIPGLRQIKELMRPIGQIEMFEVIKK